MADEGNRGSVEGGESILEIVNINNDGISKNSRDGNNEVVYRKHNGNKRTECKVCFKTMRNDNLRRHMKQHQDLMLMDEEEARREIHLRTQIYMEK